MEISRLFEYSDIIADFDVLEYNADADKLHYKLKLSFIDGSLLFVKEYLSGTERKYSFHWQNSSGEIMVRWDNSPYHKEVETFPHHKHIGNQVQSSKEPELNDVLAEIRNTIKR